MATDVAMTAGWQQNEPAGDVSVVVCTTGRRPTLLPLLTSIAALGPMAREVLVIENAATSRLDRRAVERTGARLVHEPRRGLDAARNRGLAEAAGSIVAFVDDDCLVEPGWLERIAAPFVDPRVALVTGRVLPLELATPSQVWFERWCPWDRGLESFELTRRGGRPWFPASVHQLGTGCNMAFRRRDLLALGGFDEALDMGSLIGGGGDLDAFARIIDHGHVAHYEAGAVVRHRHRATEHDLRWQVWGYGVAQGALLGKGIATRRGVRRQIARFAAHRVRVKASQLIGRRPSGLPRRILALEVLGLSLGPLVYPVSRAVARWRRRR